MKTSMVTKSVFSLVVMFVCSMMVSASMPRDYKYDTKFVDGKVVSKTVFSQVNGLLNKQVRYEFTYNTDGKVAEKKAYRWNGNDGEWTPYYLISYKYDKGSIESTYGMWNKRKNNFTLGVQSMTIPEVNYKEIFN